MSNVEKQILSPRDPDETESARKRMRTEGSARKSWSLTEKKADQDVLQEMGVSLLEPDDSPDDHSVETTLLKPGMKRKYNLENVNPNVNGASRSPRRSPRCSPLAGRSPPLAPAICLSPKRNHDGAHHYVIEEETPEAVLPSAPRPARSPRRAHAPSPAAPSAPADAAPAAAPAAPDVINRLSDEVLLAIFRWLPKRTLARCMLVSKRWHRVSLDESLWQRLELGGRVLARGALGRVLARRPAVVRLAGAEIGEWSPAAAAASRVLYLDLSMCKLSATTLRALLAACPALLRLSAEAVPLDDAACARIGECTKLETLNLTMATGVTERGLTDILRGCTGLQSLNISWCELSAGALEAAARLLPAAVRRLNLAGARHLTDDVLARVAARAPLVQLDISDCGRVTSLPPAPRLQHLALSRCYLLPPHALTKLSGMPSLRHLEVWGMLHDSSLAALRAALPDIQLNQFMHSAIARPTVGARRTSIWGLRTRD